VPPRTLLPPVIQSSGAQSTSSSIHRDWALARAKEVGGAWRMVRGEWGEA